MNQEEKKINVGKDSVVIGNVSGNVSGHVRRRVPRVAFPTVLRIRLRTREPAYCNGRPNSCIRGPRKLQDGSRKRWS